MRHPEGAADDAPMDRSDLLARIPLFKGLTPEDRHALGKRLTERSYGRAEPIFNLGDTGTSMYLVVAGSVHIYLPPPNPGDSQVGLKMLRAGDHFGELSLFDDKPRSASAAAMEPTTLLELSRDEFVQSLARAPGSVLAILSEMGNRLRDTNVLLSQRTARNAVREVEENLNWAERLADKVASINGSWQFIIFLCAVSVLWAAVNLALSNPFDAYPYVFFNLVLALIVALQGPLIVMSQNRQAEKERAQAASDFQVNLKNEVMIETLVRELAEFRRESAERMEKLEGSALAARSKVPKTA